MKWIDTLEVVDSLIEAYPNISEPFKLSLPELHKMVCNLQTFDDDPKKSNEKILEAILQTWSEELS